MGLWISKLLETFMDNVHISFNTNFCAYIDWWMGRRIDRLMDRELKKVSRR